MIFAYTNYMVGPLSRKYRGLMTLVTIVVQLFIILFEIISDVAYIILYCSLNASK